MSSNTRPVPDTSEQSACQRWFVDMWYNKRWWAWLLLPLTCVYQLLTYFVHSYQKKRAISLPVPVVVVGNISVGGTGKTPIIIQLAKTLSASGIVVGVISRGYGSQAPHYPYEVTRDHQSPHETGDEPLLIARATSVPVVIDQDRVAAAQYLLRHYPQTQIILSDDGLQHYRLARQYEIIVVDGDRGLGNHWCLPAGPLRESASRLASADCVLINRAGGFSPHTQHADIDSDVLDDEPQRFYDVQLSPVKWRNLADNRQYALSPLPWLLPDHLTSAPKTLLAVAGIGNPQRFFKTLCSLSMETFADVPQQVFDDHHQYVLQDVKHWQPYTVVMTEKDAVKCQALIQQHPELKTQAHSWWSVMVDITLPPALVDAVTRLAHSNTC